VYLIVLFVGVCRIFWVSSTLSVLLPFLEKKLYKVIHKSMKYFKNSQQIDYATDHGNSYSDRERNFPNIFQRKVTAHSCPDLPLGLSQQARFLHIPKHKMTAHVY
jgi:hypothetical protein